GLKEFCNIISALRESAATLSPSEVVEKAFQESGYREALNLENTPESRNRIENVEELISAAKEYEEEEGGRTLTGFLERTSLVSATDSLDNFSGAVSMMTFHLSKGLEFPSVFMTGMEEMIFPHSRSMDSEEEIDEERRLCYVGMTRAKEKLYLTNARTRRIFGREQFNDQSPFIFDIPESLLTRAAPPVKSRLVSPKDALFFKTKKVKNGNIPGDKRFMPGAKITHPTFGQGLILKKEGEGEGTKLTIYFKGGAGKKKIASSFFTTLK
ncbi:MAG: 3'-5' exonuclease, partial [Nitrospinota bacterium]